MKQDEAGQQPFKKKIYDTEIYERELLKILLSDKIALRRIAPLVNADWMSDSRRGFILHCIMTTFRDANALTNRDLLLFELDKKIEVRTDEGLMKAHLSEIDIILSLSPSESADFLIARLEETERADALAQLLENSWGLLEKGEVEEATREVRAGSIGLASKKKKNKASDIDRDSEEWFDSVLDRKNSPGDYVGIPTGFTLFDKLTGGLFPAELIIVFGLSGKGKSTVLKAICNNVRESGFNVLHVTNEENEWQVKTKYQSLGSGIEYNKFKRGRISDDEIDAWKAFNIGRKAKKGSIYVLEIPQMTDATWIESAFLELKEQGVDIDLICVDYMDLMGPTRASHSENDEQAKVTGDFKQMAIDCNVPVLSATQAATDTEKQETKDHPFLTAQNIFGTKRKAHAANMLVGIVNKTANVGVSERDPEENRPHSLVFCVPKNRDGPVFTFRQLLYPSVGRFDEDTSEDTDASEEEKRLANILEKGEEPEKKTEGVAPIGVTAGIQTTNLVRSTGERLHQEQKRLDKDFDEMNSANTSEKPKKPKSSGGTASAISFVQGLGDE